MAVLYFLDTFEHVPSEPAVGQEETVSSVKPTPQAVPRRSVRRKHLDFRQKTATAPVRHAMIAVSAAGDIYRQYEFHLNCGSPSATAKPELL